MRHRTAVLGLTTLLATTGLASPAAAAPAPEVTLLTPQGGEAGESLTLTAAAPEGTAVFYRMSGGAETSPTVFGPFTTAPFSATFTAKYAPGSPALTVEALTCDDGATPSASQGCVGQSSGAQVQVARLQPKLISTTERFSPNGDGKYDTAAVKVRLDQTSGVTLHVQDMENNRIGIGVLSKSLLPAGDHTLRFDGIVDTLGNGTKTLANGTYVVWVVTGRSLPGSFQMGTSPTYSTIVVDKSAKTTVSVDGAVFPAVDRYRDTAKVALAAKEAGTFKATVRSPKGKTVRTFTGTVPSSGKASFRWDGSSSSGKVQPAGKYTLAVTFTDKVANKKATSATVVVDGRHLEKRTASRTVNPTESATLTLEDECNYVFYDFGTDGDGSLALSSEGGCTWLYKPNLAGTDHEIRLKGAVKYGSVKVAVTGDRVRSSGEVLLTLLDDTGYSSRLDGAGLLVKGDTASTKWISLGALGTAPKVTWGISAHDGAAFVVESFKVTYTYYVLVK